MTITTSLPEIGFYYPGHLWQHSDWVKALLLFFDGIGVLIPEYKQGEPEELDPVLAGPLRDKGLLHFLIADEVVDRAATQRMTKPLIELVSSGALDALKEQNTAFHAISMSRMGYYGDIELARELFNALSERGLARPSQDGRSIPLHPLVRYLILILLAQILRDSGANHGLDLWPATDRPEVVNALTEFLELPANASAGQVVAFDLQTVCVDLTSVPLDEVLSFREMHQHMFRQYARSVRAFSRELSRMPPNDRSAAFDDRQAELDDLASDLKRASRQAWRRPATFSLGLAGATWTYVTGDWIGALLGGSAVLAGELTDSPNERSAFSYLFEAREHFRR